MKRLPISVIIPTLNCREKLEQHLDASEEWLSEIGEVIAVDSHSTDGTADVLNKRLGKYGARIITEEKGLYRCWNKGISLAKYPYTYISTVGDTIDKNGINDLLRAFEKHTLDVLISTPRIVDESGRELEGGWPIHRIGSILPHAVETWIPSSVELVHLSAGFAPGSILGSSASNLYKTSLLQNKPFPENVGHIGDVLWGILNLPEARVGITRRKIADFCWDGHRDKSRERQLQEEQLILQALESADFPNIASSGIAKILVSHALEEKILLLSENMTISTEVAKLREWNRTILSSRFNKIKIQYIDSFSIRKTLKKLLR